MSLWDDDESLMADLAEATGRDQTVPAHRRAAAQAAFAWRTVDEELMQLSYDSLASSGTAVRGADGPRLMSFAVDGLAVELEVGDGTIWGQILPGGAYRVTIESATRQRASVVADESGIFSLDLLPGPVSFVLELGGAAWRTEWMLI